MISRKIFSLLAFAFFFGLMASASSVSYTKQDSLAVENYLQKFKSKKDLSVSQLTIETAKHFLGKPYVASTLEGNKNEKLVVNLRQFDCTTFVETCVALVQTLKDANPSFGQYCDNLKRIRYRYGQIDDYSSRLHYISDWAYDNRETFLNIGESLGGYLETKEINYMSEHSNLYANLKNNQTYQKKIKIDEARLNKRGGYYVIQKERLTNIENELEDGDIIVFATNIPGLDFTHIGFAYYENRVLKFIHASSAEKKVVIEKRTLIDYCNQSKKCVGVMILRQID